MRKLLFAGVAIAVIAPLFGTSAMAQMSADEIYRRLEMQSGNLPQPQSGSVATRGMQLNYGLDSEAPSVSSGPGTATELPLADSPTVTIFDAPASDRTVPSYETTTLPLEATDDPVELFYPQPTVIDTVQPGVTPQPVALQTYVPVQEEARIDLRVYFEWNSAALRPEAIGQLAALCDAVRRISADRVFKIIGHTDKSGSDAYNLYLSEARAREVKRHLVEECAVPESSLLAVGEGERQSDPNSPQRAPDERRVEVQLIG